MTRIIAAIALLCCAGALFAQAQPPAYPAGLNQLLDNFMADYFAFQPSEGTRAGLHQYDAQFEDFSAARIQKQLVTYHRWERRLAEVNPKGWSRWAAADRDMLLAFVRSRHFELSVTMPWANDPGFYVSVASDSALVLVSREFAPPEQRLRSLVARQQKMPAFFAQARENLKNPPHVFTEMAIEQLPDVIDFFRHDLPAAFSGVKDQQLQEDFARSTAAAVSAMQDYLAWLKQDLLARSNGDFRLGAANLRQKLLYEEMVSDPLDQLLARGIADTRRNQQEFARAARLIDPSKTPQQVLADLQKEHPAREALIQAFGDQLAGLQKFCDQHHIITTPPGKPLILKETPPFMRATSFASMDAPGPFETNAAEAFFNVTLPDPSLTPAQVEDYMQGYSWGVISNTAVHEAIPGHYEQYLWNPRVPSRIRQFLSLDLSFINSHWGGTNVEGWAHYTEQMMMDEGFGRTPGVPEEKDLAWLKLRLGQLQDALLRDARYVVAIRMHTGHMSFDEAVEYFQKEGYQTRTTALAETRRGTQDPTYLMYTLGKLQILELREELKRRQGAKFNLQDFHDRLMEQGVAPLAVIRQAMLGEPAQHAEHEHARPFN